jgi:hypothetical protein
MFSILQPLHKILSQSVRTEQYRCANSMGNDIEWFHPTGEGFS